MKIFSGLIVVLLTVIVSGIIALMMANALAAAGMLGSCFEGSCGYIAIFAVFPLLWIIMLIGVFAGYAIWRRGRGPRK